MFLVRSIEFVEVQDWTFFLGVQTICLDTPGRLP